MKRLLVFLLVCLCKWTFGQSTLVDTWDRVAFQYPLFEHAIPLSLLYLDSVDIGNSSVNYFHQNQSFKDAYAPALRRGFKVNSERYTDVNDWKIWGKFSFSKYQEQGASFTSMVDPYRSNPYKIADSVGDADWRKQHYLLKAFILSPQFKPHFRASIEISYDVLNGARDRDPRPLDKEVHIELSPMLLYMHQRWIFGLQGYYQKFREDLNISVENTQRPQNIYKLLGMGAYLYNRPIILSGGLSREYNGNTFGGGITLARMLSNEGRIQASLAYRSQRESVTDGTTSPFDAGLQQGDTWNGTLSYLGQDADIQNLIQVSGTWTTSQGTESVQVLNGNTQQYETLYKAIMHRAEYGNIQLDYQAMRLKGANRPTWDIHVTGNLTYNKVSYIPTSSLQEISNYQVSAQFKKFLPMGSKRWTIAAETRYKGNLDNTMEYLPDPSSTNYVAQFILYPNFYYAITPYWSNALSLEYTFAPFKHKKAQIYIQGGYMHIVPRNEQVYYPSGLKNQMLEFKLGLYN